MRRIVLIAAAAGALLATCVAGASTPLSLHRVSWGSTPKLLTLKIELNRAWTRPALAPATGNDLRVLYDSNGDGKADYTGRVVYRGTALVAEISGHGNTYDPVPVSRPSATLARYTTPFDVLYTGVSPRKTLRIAVRMSSGGRVTRIPATGWLAVPR